MQKKYNINSAYTVAKTILFAVLVVFAFAVLFFLQTRSKINDPFEFAKYDQWDGTTDTAFVSGSGTPDAPYVIASGKQLAYFMSLLNGVNNNSYNTLHYRLNNNIDMNNYSFNAIENFQGHFDGNGYSIANLNIQGKVDNNNYYGGLFTNLTNATVSNINIKNASIVLNDSDTYTTVYIGTISATSDNSTINNIGVYNSNFTSYNNSEIGGIVGSASNNTTISTCLADVNATASTGSQIGAVVGNNVSGVLNDILFYETNITTVIGSTDFTNITNLYSYNADILYSYTFNDTTLVLDKSQSTETLNSIATAMTSSIQDAFIWRIDEEFIRFDNTSNVAVLTGQTPAIPITTGHASGVENATVYINDFESDYGYYRGLNYTTPTGEAIPTQEFKDIYGSSNLIQVIMTYSSSDINNANLKGYVSETELQDTYVYYKMYVVNNNGTPDNASDDYVEIELIDNPFTKRPTDMGFNGWTTNYQNALISFDNTYYIRKIRIPVTYTNNSPNQIQITLHASWTEAKVGYISTGMANAFSSFDKSGLHELKKVKEVWNYPDLSAAYVKIVMNRDETCEDCYNNQLRRYTNYKCTSSSCNMYYVASNYDFEETYYVSNGTNLVATTVTTPTLASSANVTRLTSSMNMAGYFMPVTYNSGQAYPSGYYDVNGNVLTGGTCNETTCTFYHLLQYQDNVNYNSNNTYYYLATRDTNIAVLDTTITSGSKTNRPYTMTSVHNGVDYTGTATYDITSTFHHCFNDINFENMKITSGKVYTPSLMPANGRSTVNTFYGNAYNNKLGRGLISDVEGYAGFSAFIGSTNVTGGTEGEPLKYRLIVESGKYNGGTLTNGNVGNNATNYFEAKAIYGNDYDRVTLNNDDLIIYANVAGSLGGHIHAGSQYGIAFDTTYKSGSFGLSQTDNVAGTYVGQRQGGTNHSIRRGVIEGGWIYNLIGGPQSDASRADKNDLFIYIKGGVVTVVTAGAGSVATYGNRIVQMTSGIVENSLFGGSNASGGSEEKGILNGSTYIYVGGDALIGSDYFMDRNIWKFQAESGSIFGIGNGTKNRSSVGTADNSYILITENAHIRRNVYGGGNYGAVGVRSTSDTNETIIKIIGGTIDGSVFGAGNNNGSGTTDKRSTINITMSDGLVKGSIYGGSNQLGVVYGTINVNLLGGTINTSVYGGGQGGYRNANTIGTYVDGNVNVTVGNRSLDATPIIGGNVYGGSAYGTVNYFEVPTAASTDYSTNVTINKVDLTGSVFGGGQGNGTYAPHVAGPINVTINGSNLNNVYGGCQSNGSPESDVRIYLKGGVVSNTYGGGQAASTINSYVYLQDGTSDYIYGGSETRGTVENSYIIATSGTTSYIYGGNKSGGTTGNTNVSVTGLNIPNVYGGGYRANVTGDTHVILDGVTIAPSETVLETNLYGGGQNGTVGGATNLTIINSAISPDFFAGGNAGAVGSSNLTITGGTIAGAAFGGGNAAIVDTNTAVIIAGATMNKEVYGGGNFGDVNGSTDVNIINTTLTKSVYGGGNLAQVLANTNVNVLNVVASEDIFGGGKAGNVTGNSTITVDDSTLTNSVYGGGNVADVLGNTIVNVAGTTTVGDSIFGGGNSGAIGTDVPGTSSTTVNVLGATVARNVYGGCNTSVVFGRTEVNVGSAAPSSAELLRDDIVINGTVFGGGEANAAGSEIFDFTFISVTRGIEVNIDGALYTDYNFSLSGSVFGSGNASSSRGDSNITINKLGTRLNPNILISIQRAKTVEISDSTIELTGTTDRTTIYNRIKYSLNRIEHFNIKDNTTLLLHQNANVLQEFNSLATVNGSVVKASATIDQDGNATKNTDNRLYMIANKNLNISINETANTYGTVTGMTFFGMYTIDENNNYRYGIYEMENGDPATSQDIIVGGSYVMGLHVTDSQIDGFYTNVLEEDATNLKTQYITPTPPTGTYHIWSIGLEAVNYSVELTASKYASLGTKNLQLRHFYHGNTIFEVLDFSADNLETGVSLVDAMNVPKIASTTDIANNTYGLTMKAETTEWTNTGATKYYSNNNGTFTGTTRYVSDNTTAYPILTFYLYHAKNITLDRDLGIVTIALQGLTPTNEIEYEVSLIMITVNLLSATYTDNAAYDASITYGKKYELPATTDVNITTNSAFTAYFSLYDQAVSLSDIYGTNNDYYHTLTSNYALPEGTEITMIDTSVSETNPLYYSYTVTASDYAASVTQLANENETTYKLNKFKVMSTTTANNKYSDSIANQTYYRSGQSMVLEEFLFIFDFKDTAIPNDQLANSIMLELRTSDDRTSIAVLSTRQALMVYNLYLGSNVVLESTSDRGDNYLYYGIEDRITYNVTVGYDLTSNLQSIIDTEYENNGMGINLTLYDATNTVVSSSLLVGTTITIGNTSYYASSDGVYRIKLAEKVSNVTKVFKINIGDSLTSGIYTLKIELFSSPDGMHINEAIDNTTNFNYVLVGKNNAISATIDNAYKIIDGLTGLNIDGANELRHQITYESVLVNPNIRMSLYLKNKTAYSTTTYTEIDLASICSGTLILPSVYSLDRKTTYEYMLYRDPTPVNYYTLNLVDLLTSGTYKFVFRLYDGDQLIDEDEDYVIVKKPIIE